jgi:hypothetical protein
MRRGVQRALTAITALALTIGGGVITASPAVAHDRGGEHLWVTLHGDGSTASISDHEVRPGWLTITFRGSAQAGTAATVVALRHGVRLSRFLARLTVAGGQSTPPPEAAAAIRSVQRSAIGYGGADTLPGRAVTDTVRLPHEGTYYVVNFAESGKAVSLGRLVVKGHHATSRHPQAAATVTLGDESRAVIEVAGRLPRHGTIRVHNDGDSIHLLEITPVAPGVTDARVQAEYSQLLAGKKPTSDPAGLQSRPDRLVGTDAESPGRTDYLHYRLPRGTYLLQSFVPDAQTGVPEAFEGMHKVVVIR